MKKDPDKILKPDQLNAKCFKFFDSSHDMMKWMEKEDLLKQLDFTYCREPEFAEVVWE